jgi:hypothetical protein
VEETAIFDESYGGSRVKDDAEGERNRACNVVVGKLGDGRERDVVI